MSWDKDIANLHFSVLFWVSGRRIFMEFLVSVDSLSNPCLHHAITSGERDAVSWLYLRMQKSGFV